MARNRHKGNRIGEGFVALPYSVLNSPLFTSLSPHALKLMLDLAAQYRGDNNGDLALAWKLMQPRGWRSEATLHKAKRELLDAGFLYEAQGPAAERLFAVRADVVRLRRQRQVRPRCQVRLRAQRVQVQGAVDSGLGTAKKRCAYFTCCSSSSRIATRREVGGGPTTTPAVAIRGTDGGFSTSPAVVLSRRTICRAVSACCL